MNSKRKGKRGELEFVNELRKQGYCARRGCQFHGSPESPDVICEDLENIHWEIKRVERLNLEAAFAQAVEDIQESEKFPVVAHKRNRGCWMVTLTLDDFLSLIELASAAGPAAAALNVKEHEG